MKQLAQYQDGRLEIQEVPEPQAPPGGIVVRTTHSVHQSRDREDEGGAGQDESAPEGESSSRPSEEGA